MLVSANQELISFVNQKAPYILEVGGEGNARSLEGLFHSYVWKTCTNNTFEKTEKRQD